MKKTVDFYFDYGSPTSYLADTQWVRTNVPGIETRPPDGITRPESIADYYLFLHRQPRDAWTFELDLRPWSETW